MNRWIDRWNAYWFPQTTTVVLSISRIVAVAAQLLLFFPHLETNINLMEKNTGFISPQFLIVAISALIPRELFFTPSGFSILYWVTIVTGASALIGLFTRTSVFMFALGNWILIAHGYSYADVHHPEALFCIFLILLAFSPSGGSLSVDALLRRRRQKKGARSQGTVHTAIWPLKLAHVLLALTYFSTGFSKMIYGGLQWMNGYTLQYYMLSDAIPREIPWGIWLAQQHELCILLSIYTIFFELFFFVSVFMRRTAPYFLISGIFFQMGLYLFAGHPFFQHIILLMLLLVFFEYERCKTWLERIRLLFAAEYPKTDPLVNN